MRATGLILSSEAISLVRLSAKTAAPQGVKDQAAQQKATHVALAEARDRSTSSRLAQPDREVRWGWQETTKESLFR